MKATHNFNMFWLMVLTVALVGCGTKTIYVDKIQYVFRTPPEALLKDCAIEPPPDPGTFVALPPEERETQLSSVMGSNFTNLGRCNTDKRSLRVWAVEQKTLEKKANDERPK